MNLLSFLSNAPGVVSRGVFLAKDQKFLAKQIPIKSQLIQRASPVRFSYFSHAKPLICSKIEASRVVWPQGKSMACSHKLIKMSSEIRDQN